MNAKDIKKYNLITTIAATKPDSMEIADMFTELAGIDFAVAFEVWEYMLNLHQKDLSDVIVAANLEGRIFNILNVISESKTKQLLVDSLPLNRLIYTCCATAAGGTNLQFVANLVLANKLDAADEILKNVRANTNIDFGDGMKAIIDAVFSTYCAKNNAKKCELSRKQVALLQSYVDKIKGPNKSLLTQRLKEI
jgi:hypothetical protein